MHYFGHLLEMSLYLRHILVTIWTSDQVLGTIWAPFGHTLVMYVTKMFLYSHRSGAPEWHLFERSQLLEIA